MRYFNDVYEEMAGAGLDPVPLKMFEKAPFITGWQSLAFEPGPKWAYHGACHRTHTVGALDADIEDVDLAMQFWGELGELWPIRVGKPPKWALLIENNYGNKIVSPMYQKDGKTARLEFLGDGQQLVMFNIHPGTRREYQWLGDPFRRIRPVLDPEAVQNLFVALCEARGWTIVEQGRVGARVDREALRREIRAEILTHGLLQKDPVLDALLAADLVRYSRAPGKYELWCPWGEEHENGHAGGAFYQQSPASRWPPPRFHCCHATCIAAGRDFESLKKWAAE